MTTRTLCTFIFFLLITQGNIFAINMQRGYKIPQEKIDALLKPAIEKPYIIKVHLNHKQKAKQFASKIIFVKRGLRNLGKYRWINHYKAYINTKNGRALFFRKNKTYLISNIKTKHNEILENKLNSINKNNLSKKELKKIFKLFTGEKIDKKREYFYSILIKDLSKDKLLYLRNREYFLLIDKNIQKSYVFLYHKKNLTLEYIGGDKISTGNSTLNTRNSRFAETPLGIINRKRYRMGDWHANKTNFSEYGTKGNRVFYLGQYLLPLAYDSKIKRNIHLAIHSTNPIDSLLLGHKASKGCIRISDNLNNILRKSALIDGKNGKYVIIVDSKLSIKQNIKRMKRFFTYKLKRKKHKKYAMNQIKQ